MQHSLYIRYASPCLPTRPRLFRPFPLNKLAPPKPTHLRAACQQPRGRGQHEVSTHRDEAQGKAPARRKPYPSSARDIPQRADCYPSHTPRTALSLLRDIPREACPYPTPRGELALPFTYTSYSVAPRAAWGLSPSLARAAVRRARAGASGGGFGEYLPELLANSKKGLIFAAQTGQEAAHERLKS